MAPGGTILSRNNTLDMDQLTDAAYYILLSLLVPRHGYGIMSYIEKLTEGKVTIGPATAYTLLRKLQENECIINSDEEDQERRKTYIITGKGNRLVTNEIDRRTRMAEHGKQALLAAKEESNRG
jgi:DNA-binding PadR family transcriptional regulator